MTGGLNKQARQRSYSIKARTIILLAIIIIVTLIANLYIAGSIRSINSQVDIQSVLIGNQEDLFIQQQQSIEASKQVVERVNLINQAVTTISDMNYWYFHGSLTWLIESVEAGRVSKAELEGQLNKLKSLDPENIGVFDQVLKELETYTLYANKMFEMYETNSISMGKAMAQGAKDQSDKMATLLNDMRVQYIQQQSSAMEEIAIVADEVSLASKSISDSGESISVNVGESISVAMSVTLGLIVLAVILGVIFLRSLLVPITRLSKVIQRIESTNNVSLRTEYKRNDELGLIAVAFDSMMTKFQGTIEQMSMTASELKIIAETAHSGSAALTENVRTQQTETDMVAAATTEMSASAVHIKENTDMASDLAGNAQMTTNEGRRTMEASVTSLEGLHASVTSTATSISELARNTEEIGGVLDVIRGISDQTNLLALNAAIEAARAGEQGRGFAVVADEVRNLASRTNQSTIEIQETVAKLQEGASSAVVEIKKSQVSGQENMESIRLAAETMTDVASAVEQITDLNSQIAQASGEQSSVAGSIDTSISRISSQVDDLSENASQREGAAESLRQLSEQLKQLVDSFVTR